MVKSDSLTRLRVIIWPRYVEGDCFRGYSRRAKEKTRRTLIDAAFSQLCANRSFSNLSLREVAREAGIAPTSFYRHFRDMEELGLTLVDEGA